MARPSGGQRQPGAPCRSAMTTADPGRIIQEIMSWMAFLSWMGLIVFSWYSPKFTVFSKSQGYSSGTITMNCNTRNSKFQILHTEGRLRGPFSQGHSRAEANYVKCPETGSEWAPFLASCQYPSHWHAALTTLSPVFRLSFSDWYGCVYAPREGILKREKKETTLLWPLL